jgi:thiamine pyrophosphokinase
MSFENAALALEQFTVLHSQYKQACDMEAVRSAEKASADAELALAVASREQADTAAESALAVLLQELASIGVTVPPPSA